MQSLPIIVLAAACFLTAVPRESSGQTVLDPVPSAVPTATTAIPQADVATQATEVAALLRTYTANLTPSPDIETIQQALPGFIAQLDPAAATTADALQGQPTFETLQAQVQIWQQKQTQATTWLTRLTQRAIDLRETLKHLTDLQKTWQQTRDAAQAASAPEPILQQIDTTLAAIAAAQAPLQIRQNALLDLQNRVAGAVSRCGDVLAQIAQAQQSAVSGLLTRDSLPLWDAEMWAQALSQGPARIRQIAADQWTDIVQYLSDPAKGLPLQIGLFAVLALLLSAARRRIQRWTVAGEGVSVATRVFDYPYSAALLAALFTASSPSFPIPPAVRNLFSVLGLAPMIRLTRPVIDPRLLPELYALGILYALDTVREILGGAPLFEQILLVLETLAGIAVLGWSLSFGSLRRLQSPVPAAGWTRLNGLRLGAGLIMLGLAAALAAGVLGYLHLAGLLVSGLVGGGTLALALVAAVRVLTGVAVFALRVRPLRLLHVVRHYRQPLERRIYRTLVWLAVGVGLLRWLDYIGLLQPALTFVQAVLTARLERGSISLSLGDVGAFLLTVWLAYHLSAGLRLVLQEDVYSRKGVPPGSSYAISSLLNYLILAAGFVLALGMLGLDLSRVSLLAGAFGVGIGFGLQGVVNNFVSGLILLFERPVQVGDTVELGDLLGEVRHIGMRASTVHTWRGADIIVPNAQFVTEQVTNWTLSDRQRRIDLPVSVNYGADPRQVIALLEAAAHAHAHILQQPPPQGFLLGYGDSTIDFELWAWTDRFGDWPRIRSDLAIAIYDAVQAAGLTFPFPQREVRLLDDPVAGFEHAAERTPVAESDRKLGNE